MLQLFLHLDSCVRFDLQLAVLLVHDHDVVLGQLLLRVDAVRLHIISFVGSNVRLRIGTNVCV